MPGTYTPRPKNHKHRLARVTKTSPQGKGEEGGKNAAREEVFLPFENIRSQPNCWEVMKCSSCAGYEVSTVFLLVSTYWRDSFSRWWIMLRNLGVTCHAEEKHMWDERFCSICAGSALYSALTLHKQHTSSWPQGWIIVIPCSQASKSDFSIAHCLFRMQQCTYSY